MNPHLSQIERGLRRPSADILERLATGLRLSAETLYARAGVLHAQPAGEQELPVTIMGSALLTERQKRVLLDIYLSFRRENACAVPAPPPEPGYATRPPDAAAG